MPSRGSINPILLYRAERDGNWWQRLPVMVNDEVIDRISVGELKIIWPHIVDKEIRVGSTDSSVEENSFHCDGRLAYLYLSCEKNSTFDFSPKLKPVAEIVDLNKFDLASSRYRVSRMVPALLFLTLLAAITLIFAFFFFFRFRLLVPGLFSLLLGLYIGTLVYRPISLLAIMRNNHRLIESLKSDATDMPNTDGAAGQGPASRNEQHQADSRGLPPQLSDTSIPVHRERVALRLAVIAIWGVLSLLIGEFAPHALFVNVFLGLIAVVVFVLVTPRKDSAN